MHLEVLLALLIPFTQVVMAVQRRTAVLADVYRYFIYLGFKLAELRHTLPLEFAEHCFKSFNFRFEQMVTPICHLALFLHPKFRHAFDKAGSLVKNVHLPALELLQKLRRGSPQNAKLLLAELALYKIGSPPYDVMWVKGMSLSMWWKAINVTGCKLLVIIGRLLAAICPHAADVERLFSIMGWYHSDKRGALDYANVGQMSKIKLAYGSDQR